MKKLITLIFLLALMIPLAMGEGEMPLSHEAVKERMRLNPYLNLIDIRAEENFHEGHLPRAISMPLNTLESQLQSILNGGFSYMETEIIVYGESAEDAFEAAEIISSLGFSNVSYAEDAAAWPYQMIDTETEIAQAQRILGGMEAMDLSGNIVTEADLLSGHRLTMVNVWATYCNPCIREMPELGKLHQVMEEQGVQIVGILCDVVDGMMQTNENRLSLAQEIVQSTQADYLHLLPDVVLMQKLMPQITSVPTTFFLDEEGNLIGGVYLGSRSYDMWHTILQETLSLLPAREEVP